MTVACGEGKLDQKSEYYVAFALSTRQNAIEM